MAEPNCPECARMLTEICRLNFALGHAHGSHTFLRAAAQSLVEWGEAVSPGPALETRLSALREALAATDPRSPLPRP